METVLLNKDEYINYTEKNNAHFLESYEWGEVSKVRGLKPYYLGLKDNNKIVASALLLKKSLPLNYSYFYIPRGFTIDYNNYDLIKIFTNEIKRFVKEKKGIFFRIDPDIKLHTIDENAEVIDGENNYKLVEELKKIGYKRKKLTKYFETMQPRFTFRIPLYDSIEEIESRYSTTNIQRIKKSEKYGVYVEVGKKEDIKEFIRLMRMTEKRQNFYSHTEEFYNKFYEEFIKNNHVTLYLGKIDLEKISNEISSKIKKLKEELESIKDIDSKKANSRKKEINKELDSLLKQEEFYTDKPKEKIVVSSYLTVNYGNKSWALYAANDMDYKNMFANYAVYKRQIRDAKEAGLDIFDVFGTIGDPTSTSHLVGLHDFKKKWGGEYTEFIGEFDYITNKLMYLIYTKLIPLRHKIVNKMLRHKNKGE